MFAGIFAGIFKGILEGLLEGFLGWMREKRAEAAQRDLGKADVVIAVQKEQVDAGSRMDDAGANAPDVAGTIADLERGKF